MEKFKVITYSNPKDFNVPQAINKELANEKINQTCEYLIFVQNDIVAKAIDPQKLYTSYAEFCDKLNIPFAMYQYYNNFNRILPGILNKVNPRFIIHTDNYGIFDVIIQVAYGFLIINVKKMIDSGFSFNETYKNLFYIQDMLEYFSQHNLYFSNFCLLEMHDSEKLFKDPTNASTGYMIDMNEFNKEREEYFKNNKVEYKDLNTVIEYIKNTYGAKDGNITAFDMSASGQTVSPSSTQSEVQGGLVDINKLLQQN